MLRCLAVFLCASIFVMSNNCEYSCRSSSAWLQAGASGQVSHSFSSLAIPVTDRRCTSWLVRTWYRCLPYVATTTKPDGTGALLRSYKGEMLCEAPLLSIDKFNTARRPSYLVEWKSLMCESFYLAPMASPVSLLACLLFLALLGFFCCFYVCAALQSIGDVYLRLCCTIHSSFLAV